MADLLLGHSGTITISASGTLTTGAATPPIAANCRRIYYRFTRPLADITRLGDTTRKFKHSLSDGGTISFDVLIDGDAATPPLPFAPTSAQGTVHTLTVIPISGNTYAGEVKIHSLEIVNITVDGNPAQAARYTAKWNSDITVSGGA